MKTRQTLAEAVSAEVRAEMGRQQKSRREVADAMGVSHMYLSRRLNGRTPFDLTDLDRIAAALGVPVARLLRDNQAA